jgi:thiamine biosynthesis lipoprotein
LKIIPTPITQPIHRFSHEAMATFFEVFAAGGDPDYAAQAAHAAFDLIDRLERELSRFIPNSDIGRVNALGAGERTRVTPTTLECLVIARHMFDLTGGAFDVSIGTGLPSLELDADAFEVRATTDGVRVDLGGIGKGYAVDLVGELLEEWGLTRALVHGGFSSMLALDPPPDADGWPLTLSDPAAPSRVLERLSVRQAALGASGIRKTDHIVDPGTGDPVRERLATWVTVPRPEAARRGADPGAPRLAAAAVADALTTALMLLPLDAIEALCANAPGVEAWVLTPPADPSAASEVVRFPRR